MAHRLRIVTVGLVATAVLAAATAGFLIFTGKGKAFADVPSAKVSVCLNMYYAVGTFVKASFSGFDQHNVWANSPDVQWTTTTVGECVEIVKYRWKVGQSINIVYDIRGIKHGDFSCKITDTPDYVPCYVPS